MKKIFFVACALLASAALMAAPLHTQKTHRSMSEQPSVQMHDNMQTAVQEINTAEFTNLREAVKTLNAYQDTMYGVYDIYGHPRFNLGIPDVGVHATPPTIVIPYKENDQLLWYSGYGNADWMIGDETVLSDTLMWLQELEGGWEATYPLPTIKTLTGGDSILYEDYQYGRNFCIPYVQYGFEPSVEMGSQYVQPLTTHPVYMEDTTDFDLIFVNQDIFRVGGDAATFGSPYMYGSKMISSANGLTLDTLFTLVPNTDLMYINNLQYGYWNANSNTESPFVAGDTIRMGIYYLTEEGAVDWANPVATGFATDDDFEKTENYGTYKGFGLLNFYFYEENILGGLSAVPAIVEGKSFVVALTNLTKVKSSFGILVDYFNPFPCESTYFCANGKYTTLWKYPSNLYMTMRAYFPKVLDMPTNINFTSDQLSQTITIQGNVATEYWEELDKPEWLNVEMKDSTLYYPEYDAYEYLYSSEITFSIDAENLGKTGTVELWADGLNFIIEVTSQGSDLNNVKAINDNKTYNIFGVEVNKDYKGVVIKNGTKLLQ